MSSSEIIYLDIDIDDSDIKNATKCIVKTVREGWALDKINIQRFTDGISNALYGCYQEDDTKWDDVILIKIWGKGTEVFVKRNEELEIMQILHSEGCGPPVYARFKNGCCYGYVQGYCPDESQMKQEPVWKAIAVHMADIHNIDFTRHQASKELTQGPSLYQRLREWLKHVPSQCQDPEKNRRLQNEIPSKEQILKEINYLEEQLRGIASPLVLCHNDLVSENIVFTQEKEKATFIDWEYGFINFEVFDIACYFKGFAGVQETSFSRYPSKEFQMKWLKEFLRRKFTLQGKSPDKVTEKDVHTLFANSNKMALAAFVYEAIWALVFFDQSSIDFDYLGFAKSRLDEYYARRDEYLALN